MKLSMQHRIKFTKSALGLLVLLSLGGCIGSDSSTSVGSNSNPSGGDGGVDEPAPVKGEVLTLQTGKTFSDAWNFGVHGGGNVGIGAQAAWNFHSLSECEGVTVAIIDTGTNDQHPQLGAQLWENPDEIDGDGIDNDGNGLIDDFNGWNFIGSSESNLLRDDNGHGTHVAGVVAATGVHGTDLTGICAKVKIMTVKALNGDGLGSASDVIQALTYAVNEGADIINLSLAFDGHIDDLYNLIKDHPKVLFVAAAGNNGKVLGAHNPEDAGFTADLQKKYVYPASYSHLPNLISVASINQNAALSGFSNLGSAVHITAPGDPILSTGCESESSSVCGYYSMRGTSMATPHVAGSAAMFIGRFHPDLTNDSNMISDTDAGIEVKNALLNTGTPYTFSSPLDGSNQTGSILNISNILDADNLSTNILDPN